MAGSIKFTTEKYCTIMWSYNGRPYAKTPGAGSSVTINYTTDYDSTTIFRVYKYNSSSDIKQYVYAKFTRSTGGVRDLDIGETTNYEKDKTYTVTIDPGSSGTFTVRANSAGIKTYGVAYADEFGVRSPSSSDTPDYHIKGGTEEFSESAHHIWLDLKGFQANDGYEAPFYVSAGGEKVEITGTGKELTTPTSYVLTATKKAVKYNVSTSNGTGITSIDPASATITAGNSADFVANINSDDHWGDTELITKSGKSYYKQKHYIYSRPTWSVVVGEGDFEQKTTVLNRITYTPKGNESSQNIKASSSLVEYGSSRYWMTVTYNANGGKGTMKPSTTEYVYIEPTSTSREQVYIKTCDFTYSGKIFNCWSTSSEGGTSVPTGEAFISGNLNLYAIWKNEVKYTEYKVNYSSNVEASNMPENFYKNTTSTSQSVTIASKNNPPVSAGAVFLGWSTDPEATSAMSAYAPGTAITLYSSSPVLNLYAVWDFGYTANGCVLASQYDRGYINDHKQLIQINVVKNSSWTISNNIVKFTDIDKNQQQWQPIANNNYEFIAWTDHNGNKYSNSGTFNSNKIFVADFAGAKCTISFNLNGGTKVQGYENYFKDRLVRYGDQYKYCYDSSGTQSEMQLPDATMLTKQRYTFAGWTDEAGNLITGDSIVNNASNHTLTAKWEEIVYKVKFLTDKGDYADVILEDGKATIPEDYFPVWDSHTFYGWNTSEGIDQVLGDDDIPPGITYYTEDTIEYSAELFENEEHALKLYAKWKKEAPLNVIIPTSYGGEKLVPVREVYAFTGAEWKLVDEWWIHNGSGWKEMAVK